MFRAKCETTQLAIQAFNCYFHAEFGNKGKGTVLYKLREFACYGKNWSYTLSSYLGFNRKPDHWKNIALNLEAGCQ